MTRRFSAAQRVALFLLASGSCSTCGKRLEPGWHGDHVIPHHLLPETDVANGQALCPECNLKKGGRYPVNNESRYAWQREFVQRYHALDRENFTLVACPGAGKTRATLTLAKELIEVGEIDYLWIVCPNRQVKKQWWETAGEMGIDLEWKWENGDGAIPGDMSGAVVTYQAVSTQPDIHRYHISRHRTLGILDEVHHASEYLNWGQKCREAFENATRRILLSGTLFRKDGSEILYAEYDSDGYAIPNFSYGYTRAQQDFVCRPIYFPRTGGKVEWDWGNLEFESSFSEKVSKEKARQRLRAATSADLDKINPLAEQLLRDANDKLSELRAEGDNRAGGLVIAQGMDRRTGIRHAQAIAYQMERMFRQPPVLVVSDDPQALNKIRNFKDSTDRWIVSISMITEGVDISRLRVLACLSTVQSEVAFNQWAGRIARGSNDAFFFMLDDPELLGYAQRLAEQRKLALKELQETATALPPITERGGIRDFISRGGTPENAGVIFGSHRIDQVEYDAARTSLEGMGWPKPVPHEVVSKLAIALREASNPTRTEEPTVGGLLSERKEFLRKLQNDIVQQHCYLSGKNYAQVNAWLNQQVGISKLKHATEEQLRERLRLAQENFGS